MTPKIINIRDLIIVLVCVLLFVPKLNLFGVPGFTVTVKPEDFLWGIMLFSMFYVRNRLSNPLTLSFFLLLGYLILTLPIHPSNSLLTMRLVFYSIPILVYVNYTYGDIRRISKTLKLFSVVFAIIAVLQISVPMLYVHSGELFFGKLDRASGLFGNGVEFALVAFCVFWILRVIGVVTLFDWICLATIAVASGSRVAALALIISGIVLIQNKKRLILASLGTLVSVPIFTLLFLLSGSGLHETESNERLSNIDISEIVTATTIVVGSIEGKKLDDNQIGHYCFNFDDDLSEDQSFAMRLSKLRFVLEYVVLGEHKLGFGLGKCIGDAGDNLFVRSLSDGGLPYFILLALFFTRALTMPVGSINRYEWCLFMGLFILTSTFYDTLYFSRVAPLFFIILSLNLNRPGINVGGRPALYLDRQRR